MSIMDVNNLNTIVTVLAFLAKCKDDVGFAIPVLAELFGEPIWAVKKRKIRKAAKKAWRRIRPDGLIEEDVVAMAAAFLMKIGLYGRDGDNIVAEGRFYSMEDGKWVCDCDVNPAVRPDVPLKGIVRLDVDGNVME